MALVIVPFGVASAATWGTAAVNDHGSHYANQGYTAVQDTRWDATPSNVGGTDCSTPRSANSDQVWQSINIQDTYGLYAFSAGTLHQCASGGTTYEWWYFETVVNGTSTWWYKQIHGGAQHTFYLFETGSGTGAKMYFQIDSTVETHADLGLTGSQIAEYNFVNDQLASSNSGSGGTVSSWQDSALNYQWVEGSWTPFTSAVLNTPSSQMCAVLASGSTTVWNLGDNVSNLTACTN